jgi:hypothetical protein
MEERSLLVEQDSRKVKEEIVDLLDEIDSTQEGVQKISLSRTIRGKTVDDWNRSLTLNMDHSADPVQVNRMLQRVSDNLDTCQNNLNKSKFELAIFNTYYAKEKRSNIDTEANRKGKRTPGVETLETLAENALGNKSLVKDYYKFEVDFWESQIMKLSNQLKAINTMSMSNGTRYKLEMNTI